MPLIKAPKKEVKKLGRPTKYSEALVDLICERIATNPLADYKLCEMFDDMPSIGVMRSWRYKNEAFQSRYLAAKSAQSMLLVEEIDSLLDIPILYITDEKTGQQRIDPPSASIAIARCNNRKWQAARLAPKWYGDAINISTGTNEVHEQAMLQKHEIDEKNKKDY